MSKGREIADYLADILNAIIEVEEFTDRMTYDTFAADKKTVNADVRRSRQLLVVKPVAQPNYMQRSSKPHLRTGILLTDPGHDY